MSLCCSCWWRTPTCPSATPHHEAGIRCFPLHATCCEIPNTKGTEQEWPHDLLIVRGLNGLRNLSIGAIPSRPSPAGRRNPPARPFGILQVVMCRQAAGRVGSGGGSTFSSSFLGTGAFLPPSDGRVGELEKHAYSFRGASSLCFTGTGLFIIFPPSLWPASSGSIEGGSLPLRGGGCRAFDLVAL